MTTASSTDPLHALTAYTWETQPDAAAFLQRTVDAFLQRVPEAADFSRRLYEESGNRILDLVDHLTLPDTEEWRLTIEQAGWTQRDDPADDVKVFANADGIFPEIVLHESMHEIALKVDSALDFLTANGFDTRIFGEPLADVRVAHVFVSGSDHFSAVERCGNDTFVNPGQAQSHAYAKLKHLEVFCLRNRRHDTDEAVLQELDEMIDAAVADLGRDVACEVFFEAERRYWQSRNHAARWQKNRQDKLGVGWANHDHHTYRSSRRHFHTLVGLWEKLGFECRERFYPGPEAGWGAQVMEQPVCGIVTFNDVDISPDELKTDFAHDPMTERNHLGTVGLWCALHGESVLQAGMHHLECTFDFDALRDQMAESGIKTMRAFSDFDYLKQAFTEGERWSVDSARIDTLLTKGLITTEQADDFRSNGAIGSHLENLERNDGFKGFNQTGVTQIIKETDPRLAGV